MPKEPQHNVNNTDIKVSIVIPTFQGGHLFKQCLDSIFTQKTDFKFEVIVIDSGSTDDTIKNINIYPVMLYQIKKTEFNHGLTRNKGVSVAKGQFIVMMTQDAIPANDNWLCSIIQQFYDDPLIAGIYAQQIPREDADVLTKRSLNSWLTARSESDTRQIDDLSVYNSMPPMDKYMLCYFDDVCSCMRRTVWQEIPYQNAKFAEDIEWGKSVMLAGYKIAYEPNAAVIHSHDRSVFYEYKRTYMGHRRLNELFGLRTVPTFRHVIRFTINNLLYDIPYVIKEEKSVTHKIMLVMKSIPLSFLSVYAQYRGAKDQIELKKNKSFDGV